MAKKTARERDRDSMTQYEFISKFPPDVMISLKDIAEITGGEYSNTRARCRRYLDLGHLSCKTEPRTGNSKPFLSYKMTSKKKQELLNKIRDYGSLTSTKKRRIPKADHTRVYKETTPENIAARNKIYNLMMGINLGD